MRLILAASIFIISLGISNGFSIDFVVNKVKMVKGILGSFGGRNRAVVQQSHNQRPKRKVVSGPSVFKSSAGTENIEEGVLKDARGRKLKTFTWRPSGPVNG